MILLFFGSTIAFAVMEALGVTNSTPSAPTTIPAEKIFTQRNSDLELLFKQNGYTLMLLTYNTSCCSSFITYLESLTTSVDKLVLFKSASTSVVGASLQIVGTIGEASLTEKNQTAVFDSLCNVMTYPPIECGFRMIGKTNTNQTNISS